MARGRMIASAITSDKRVNDLSSDTCRLAFTWLVTFADCEGRTYGDPAMVRSMLFPRRDDVGVADVVGFISEWHRLGLVVWYEAAGDKWIWFPAFDKNQTGLRKDHEQPSAIPTPPPTGGVDVAASCRDDDAPTTEALRSCDVVTTAQVKLSQVKRSQPLAAAAAPASAPQADPAVTAVIEHWESIIAHEASPADCSKLRGWLEEYGPERVNHAVGQCHIYGAPKLAYVWRVLADGGAPRAAPDPPPKPAPSGPLVILNPLTGQREVIGGNSKTAGCEPTPPG